MNDLNKLFYWHGIAKDYFNYKGELVDVPLENRINLLRTMGVKTESESALLKSAFEVDVAPWLQWLPALITVQSNELPSFYIHLSPPELTHNYAWRLSYQGKHVAEGRFNPFKQEEIGDYAFQNTRYTRRKVSLGSLNLDPGYYQLTVSCGTRTEEATIAIVPETSWQPQWLAQDDKLWGVIIQLYTLRTENDWGIGDFSDLKRLITSSAKAGMDVIGLNPLHTLLPDLKENCSPYSPSDRRFLNPLYVDPECVPEFTASDIANDPSFVTELGRLRTASQVDYDAVKNLKYSIFEKLFRCFQSDEIAKNTARAQSFFSFVETRGAALKSLALYEAMYNRWTGATFICERRDDIWEHDIETDVFTAYVTDHERPITFHMYLQWLSEQQLAESQALAIESGMKLGLVRDLAVGANGSGSEVMGNPHLFCKGAAVGAPPDPFSDLGQNWGIPPMDPAELRASGFKHYINLLRANMASCGALRIDHAMSLLRLWWCPPDKTANHGAYVYYPFEDLLGLLKLESHLNQCVIIGEDLGVVPPEFRENMRAAKIFANKVFYFEKEHFHSFTAPQHYDEHALSMVNNHDVPTLKSWWDGSDLELRDTLNLFEEGVDYPQMLAQRAEEKRQACNLLEQQGLFPPSWQARDLNDPADEAIIFAFLLLNSRVASRIFVIQLEDLLLMDAPTNVPGTFKEYPNWQRKMSDSVENIFLHNGVQELLENIQRERSHD